MNILTQDFVLDALNSDEDFPIDFDDVWQSTGHTQKSSARAYMRRESDFLIKLGLLIIQQGLTFDNKPKEIFKLSLEGLKFAIARTTTKAGADYLLFLIQTEKAYRLHLERQFAVLATSTTTPEVETIKIPPTLGTQSLQS